MLGAARRPPLLRRRRIRLYQDPATAGLFETNIFNNEARTNYTRFVSASSSPSTRVTAQIQLANPFDESALVHAVVNSSHPYHRVFLDHRWLRVDGKSNRPVQVYDEALAGFSEADFVDDERVLGLLWKEDNRVTVEGWAERPFLSDCGAPTLTGGAAVRVGSGRATEIEITDAKQTFMGGLVRHVDDGSPVDDGTVVIVAREVDEFGGHQTADGQLDGGRFAIEFGGTSRAPSRSAKHTSSVVRRCACDSRTVKLDLDSGGPRSGVRPTALGQVLRHSAPAVARTWASQVMSRAARCDDPRKRHCAGPAAKARRRRV